MKQEARNQKGIRVHNYKEVDLQFSARRPYLTVDIPQSARKPILAAAEKHCLVHSSEVDGSQLRCRLKVKTPKLEFEDIVKEVMNALCNAAGHKTQKKCTKHGHASKSHPVRHKALIAMRSSVART